LKKTKPNSTEIRLKKAEDDISFLLGAVVGLFILIIFLMASKSNAYELGIKYGLGFGVPEQQEPSEVKFVSVEIQNSLGSLLKHKLAAGGWFDPKPVLKRSGASFGAYSIGIKVEPGIFYAENFFGVSLISQTDSMLSTNFEFTEEIGIGIQDALGRFLGFQWKHFSNAGIQLPNKGRDFMLVSTGVRL